MGEVQARRDELPGDKRIVVACRSGGRSAAITGTLPAHGYDAVNLAGGMCAWSGAAPIARVEVCINDGPWHQARLIGGRRRHS